MDTTPQTITVEGLTRRFGDFTAVDHIGFTVPQGKMTGFVGGNGAGKTTTMRMIMGVLTISEGRVLWGDRPITAADQRTIGYMPEERGLYPKQKVADQLIYLGQLRGLSAWRSRESVMTLLERLGHAEPGPERDGQPVRLGGPDVEPVGERGADEHAEPRRREAEEARRAQRRRQPGRRLVGGRHEELVRPAGPWSSRL